VSPIGLRSVVIVADELFFESDRGSARAWWSLPFGDTGDEIDITDGLGLSIQGEVGAGDKRRSRQGAALFGAEPSLRASSSRIRSNWRKP